MSTEFRSERTTTSNGTTVELGIVTHNGRQFSALGAVVAGDYVTGYLSGDGETITAWDGARLGTARVVTSWPAPRWCWLTSRFYQVEATINGRIYTGRTAGRNMLWRGRLKKRQPMPAAA